MGAAVVKEVVNIYEKDSIIERSQTTILELDQFFRSLNNNFIEEIRSVGMIFALKIGDCNNIKSEELVVKFKTELLKEGLLVGHNAAKSLLRLLPPLILSIGEVQYLKEKIRKVLDLF